jgi:hypothetical protein
VLPPREILTRQTNGAAELRREGVATLSVYACRTRSACLMQQAHCADKLRNWSLDFLQILALDPQIYPVSHKSKQFIELNSQFCYAARYLASRILESNPTDLKTWSINGISFELLAAPTEINSRTSPVAYYRNKVELPDVLSLNLGLILSLELISNFGTSVLSFNLPGEPYVFFYFFF